MENYTKKLVDTLLSVIAIDSVQGEAKEGAPFGEGAKKVLDKYLSLAREIGMRTKDLDGYCGYAEIGEGELVGIPVHLDTVPFGEDWSYSPLGEVAEINGEKMIFGRGVEDDKGPAVAVLIALKSLLDEGKTPKKRIRIIAGCNEESGWNCIEHYKQAEEIPAMSFSPDADFPVINCEKGVLHLKISFAKPEGISIVGGERVNMVADRGELALPKVSDATFAKCLHSGIKVKFAADGYVLKANGISAHGSTPEKGENALLKLLFVAKSSNDFVADLYDAFYDMKGEGLGIACADDKSGALTLNLGKADTSNDKVNIYVDIRYPVTKKEEDIIGAIAKKLPQTEISVEGRHLPLYVDKASELVQALLSAYNEVTGENAEPISIGGATYARAFPNAVAFGPVFPGADSKIHQKDECISVANLVKCAEIYKKALLKLCF